MKWVINSILRMLDICKDICLFLTEAYKLEYTSQFISIDGVTCEVFFYVEEVDEFPEGIAERVKERIPDVRVEMVGDFIMRFLYNRDFHRNGGNWMAYELCRRNVVFNNKNVSNDPLIGLM